LFADPWGYRGLSLRLIGAIIKDWGCDVIMFFNYNRINAGLENELVSHHMDALFGKERADILRHIIPSLSSTEREAIIMKHISEALNAIGGQFVLPFPFKNETGSRTTHYLIFISKHTRGHGIMKDIMAKVSSTKEQGVASFEHNRAMEQQPMLFEERPLDELAVILLKQFTGRTLRMVEIFNEHNYGTPYTLQNYKAVLKKLEA
jgi:hypothetical protein